MLNKLIKSLKKQEEFLKVFYKLAVDFGTITLVALWIFLLSEILLPGTASGKIGFIKLVFFVFFDILILYLLGNLLELKSKERKQKKSLWIALVFSLILLILGGLIKSGLILTLVLLVIFSAIIFFLYDLFFKK